MCIVWIGGDLERDICGLVFEDDVALLPVEFCPLPDDDDDDDDVDDEDEVEQEADVSIPMVRVSLFWLFWEVSSFLTDFVSFCCRFDVIGHNAGDVDNKSSCLLVGLLVVVVFTWFFVELKDFVFLMEPALRF